MMSEIVERTLCAMASFFRPKKQPPRHSYHLHQEEELDHHIFQALEVFKRTISFVVANGRFRSTKTSNVRMGQVMDMMENLQKTLSCPICLEVMSSPYLLRCGHSFCLVCINRWVGQSRTCPECRMPLEKDWYHFTGRTEAVENLLELFFFREKIHEAPKMKPLEAILRYRNAHGQARIDRRHRFQDHFPYCKKHCTVDTFETCDGAPSEVTQNRCLAPRHGFSFATVQVIRVGGLFLRQVGPFTAELKDIWNQAVVAYRTN